MKRLVTVLLLALVGSSLVFAVPVVHAQKPHSPTVCHSDTCDAWAPHSTDGGSDCVSNGLWQAQEKDMIDDRGAVEAKVYLFGSTACDVYWATVYTTTTYMSSFSVLTLRWHTIDDPANVHTPTFYFPNYYHNVWEDSGMLGHDVESPFDAYNDCFNAEADWVDRDNVGHRTITNSNCP